MSFEQTSFLYSGNADFIAGLFRKYADNPSSVDPGWQKFFAGLDGDARAMLADEHGPSWASGNGASYAAQPGSNDNGVTYAPLPPLSAPAPVPAMPVIAQISATATAPDGTPVNAALLDSIRAIMLIRVYRVRGHLLADLDPLNLDPRHYPSELNPRTYGFTEADMDRPIYIDGMLGFQRATLREILARLQTVYCSTIGVEFMHIQDPGQKAWIQERIEASGNRALYNAESKHRILRHLTYADAFEKFLATKFVGVKRFGLEGGEAMMPALDAAIARAAELGLREAVIGMAHRGRLNVLTNLLGKPFAAMFAEFQGGTPAYEGAVHGSGDVKYHLGASIDRDFNGHRVYLTMNANPSHLEWVNPVVVGRVRAKQQQRAGATHTNDEALRRVMGLLIHGDAAFAGQGIVAETLMLSELKGYRTGGTLHFVINNQVGFTTGPKHARSGVYCTDVAKMIQAPIFHVNGDDVEAVVHAAEIAAEFRQKFRKDIVIDMVCYRRHGHNEGDEPAFTQPVMYRKIKGHATTREIYARKLAQEGSVPQAEADRINADFVAQLEKNFEAASTYKSNKTSALKGRWQGLDATADNREGPATGLDIDRLRELGYALARAPDGFNLNPKIARLFEAKRKMMETGEGLDWATAESLAFATLVTESTPVRLSGQDCSRGTFSQRHSMLFDQEDGHRYVPLNGLSSHQAAYEVHDSPLSEAAVMGFDYGFSLAEPNALVCWEAQFGDFTNTAQVYIDQFLASAETKWKRMSGLTLLLPHGYEGQGPEHSSARLERYLQLCAEDNIQVANCSTPGNYFHILRRQVRRPFRKPLILMTPKSLLRHKLCVSRLSEMEAGTSFRPVIGDDTPGLVDDKKIRRVVVCGGKVYYDLYEARESRTINDVALVRLEQYYPFPEKTLAKEFARYPKADIVWCQEEPQNMGAWHFLDRRLEAALATAGHKTQRPLYAGRPEGAAPSTGSLKRHNQEQAELVDKALKAG